MQRPKAEVTVLWKGTEQASVAGVWRTKGQPPRNKPKGQSGQAAQDPGAKVQNVSVILKTAANESSPKQGEGM